MLLLVHITRRQKQLAKLKFDEVLSKVQFVYEFIWENKIEFKKGIKFKHQ